MVLEVPLTGEQIEAANELYGLLTGWCSIDRALGRLAITLPGFDLESCLIKAAAINQLYSTNVFAIPRMADHVHQVLLNSKPDETDPEFVERLASLTKTDGSGGERHFRSFASKFAHFFIDSERFPIVDSYSIQMVTHHLGRGRVKGLDSSYLAFYGAFASLKRDAGVDDQPNSHLDRYLWLAGQYRRWRKTSDAPVNSEARTLFEKPSARAVAPLGGLAGEDHGCGPDPAS